MEGWRGGFDNRQGEGRLCKSRVGAFYRILPPYFPRGLNESCCF